VQKFCGAAVLQLKKKYQKKSGTVTVYFEK
jgi:hypothetical protein